ncbi:2-ketogluconate reductase [Colletotrichum tofieldiae]|nr:2-ketogluconate reductase [Colletotrichum tofieldiae]GKT80524.1 2-ketogluconate reductase [Colletotrichum tofieldiae]GKT94884.1 2-ketogluconate reductase [Colletotrichum tofieldiae]
MHELRDQGGNVVCDQLLWGLPQQKDAFEQRMNVFNTTKCLPELTIDALWNHDKNKQPTDDSEPIGNNLKEMLWTEWVHESEVWDPKSQVYHHHASFISAEGAITSEVTAKI